MSHKLLLDTDLGSDIDDAVCLAYLLAQPECELLGITTVSGQPEVRARLASAICRAFGRTVPLYPGLDLPRQVAQRQPLAQQAPALDRWPHETEFPQGLAVDFLRETIHRHPGEVTLLAIGPLTNVAALVEADPAAVRLLRGLTLMGGMFTQPYAEWNILCDPHAAAVVYGAPFAPHRSIGLDVTRQVRLPAAEARRRFSHPALRIVGDLAGYFFAHNDTLTFHDPLAAATLFDSDLCRFERGAVSVDTDGAETAGVTGWQPNSDGPHKVALAVEAERFLKHYFALWAG